MKTIIIRCDSSSDIGIGHVMRDLVLAKQFSDKYVVFACRDLAGNINQKIIDDGYELKILKSMDIDELVHIINSFNTEMIVIDHYGIDSNYETEIKKKSSVQIFVLDDTYEKHNCDILLNHNIYGDEKKYINLVPEKCELRCGEKYTLLRDEFYQSRIIEEEKKFGRINCAVILGGSDHSNQIIEIVQELEKFMYLDITILTTNANVNIDTLKKYVMSKKNIDIIINSREFAKELQKMDFIVLTPSVILNEVFYMKIPFIAIQTADNQRYMVNYLIKNNFPLLINFDKETFRSIVKELIYMKFIDLKNFIDFSEKEKKLVLSWRNNSSVAQWMKNKTIISETAHFEYIESLKKDSKKKYFLVKIRSEYVGVIDFISLKNNYEIVEFGIYSKPNMKGVGTVLMSIVVDFCFSTLKSKKIISEVYEKNIGAINLYEKFGFNTIDKVCDDTDVLIKMELNYENK